MNYIRVKSLKVGGEFIAYLANTKNLADSENPENVISDLKQTVANKKETAQKVEGQEPLTQPQANTSRTIPIKDESDYNDGKININYGRPSQVSPIQDVRTVLGNEPVKVLTDFLPQDLTSIKHFEDKAKTLSTVIASGRDAIYTYEKGAMPELLAESFAKMVLNQELYELGPENTKVHYIDYSSMVKNNFESPIKYIENIATNANNDPLNKNILFIKDFEDFLYALAEESIKSPSRNPSAIFNSGAFGENVKIVGLVNRDIYSKITKTNEPHVPYPLVRMGQTVRENFEKQELGAPSPKKAKEILKSTPQIA